MRLSLLFSATFRALGKRWHVSNHGHEKAGSHFFNTGTIHVKKYGRFISSSHETKTPEQEAATVAFERMLQGDDD